MRIRYMDVNNIRPCEDWEGNTAAFQCPLCGKIFIVSSHPRLHQEGPPGESGYRKCPNCGKSLAHIKGGKKSGGIASIEWEEDRS